MNKFFALAMLAFVAVAATVAADEEADRKELAHLPEEQQVFKEFCLAERDSVTAELRGKIAEANTKVFTVFFDEVVKPEDEAAKQKPATRGRLAQAVYASLATMIGEQTLATLTKVSAAISSPNLLGELNGACQQAEATRAQIQDDLETAKAKLLEEHANDAELSRVIKKASAATLLCRTTVQIRNLAGMCKWVKSVDANYLKYIVGPLVQMG